MSQLKLDNRKGLHFLPPNPQIRNLFSRPRDSHTYEAKPSQFSISLGLTSRARKLQPFPIHCQFHHKPEAESGNEHTYTVATSLDNLSPLSINVFEFGDESTMRAEFAASCCLASWLRITDEGDDDEDEAFKQVALNESVERNGNITMVVDLRTSYHQSVLVRLV
ncbi:hypothetical protein DL98DRAFT_536741 [Cadophora sp. DSE1049]|nr:hypothetical protein DL98DRAFT_536741 [Cadophora sp. DSE1049]